jgi:hypothetical protein
LLPKDCKDRGDSESVEETALREIYEETGYAVPFHGTMYTCATVPNVEGFKLIQPDFPHLVSALSTVPFAITIRGSNTDNRNIKLIYLQNRSMGLKWKVKVSIRHLS